MKQRIRVVGIVKQGRDFLFLKRMGGRANGMSFWELPTGKIQFGEQPEEAMSRAMMEFAGVEVKSLRLKDAVTFLAPIGASQLNNLYIVYEIELVTEAKVVPEVRYSAYKFTNLDNIGSMKIDEASLAVLEIEEKGASKLQEARREAANGATVYVDGSSRGNPGPSGVGYYIIGTDGQEIDRGGEYIGFAVSRVAEYRALELGMKRAIELELTSVRFVSDNLMMVNQMNGIYRVKNKDLRPLYQRANSLANEFEACAFTHVKRDFNTEADKEANLAIDRHFKENMIR